MKRLFLSLLLMSFSVCAMDDDKVSYVDPETAEIFSSPFEEVPQILRKIEFDFGDVRNMPKLIENYSVDFDLERRQIIAYCYRSLDGKDRYVHVTKNLQTGQLDACASEYDWVDHLYVFVKPDLEVVLKLKQKIVEFEKGAKAKE